MEKHADNYARVMFRSLQVCFLRHRPRKAQAVLLEKAEEYRMYAYKYMPLILHSTKHTIKSSVSANLHNYSKMSTTAGQVIRCKGNLFSLIFYSNLLFYRKFKYSCTRLFLPRWPQCQEKSFGVASWLVWLLLYQI